MRYNGRDLLAVHSAVSIEREILPGMAAREIATTETSRGDIVSNVSAVQDELTVRVNIAARSYDEAAYVRGLLAEWASSSGGGVAELEPTRTPGKAYSAIVKRIGKLEKRFGTVDVVFLLPRPFLHDVTPRARTGTGTELAVQIGGSAPVQPVISFAPDAAAEGVRITADGAPFLALRGSIAKGAVLEFKPETGAVTLDGEHVENRLVYTDSNPDAEFAPGRHVFTVSAPGTMTVRWQNQWQ